MLEMALNALSGKAVGEIKVRPEGPKFIFHVTPCTGHLDTWTLPWLLQSAGVGQGWTGQVSDPEHYILFSAWLAVHVLESSPSRRESLVATDLLTEFMNPSLAVQNRCSYFLPALRNECMCCACWQTAFTVYKYHSTCSLLQWEYIRFGCCRQGTISSDNYYWKRSPVCASYIWPYSTMELFHKMYIHVGTWQDSFRKKAVFK